MKKTIFFAAACLLFGCTNENKTNEALLSQHKDLSTVRTEKISDKMISDIIKSIPSSIETSTLIKQSGGIYNITLLNSPDKSERNYSTNYKKAINLGVYGTDLGYVNIYNQSKDALNYLSCIQGLAEELKVGQFFDYETFRRMAANNSNMDSLLYLTIANFENINNFLYEQNRANHSVLMLTGGWLEALYISCKVVKSNRNKDLQEKIGEQKIVLEKILLLLSNYHEDENIYNLSVSLKQLQKVYDKVKINYSYKESQMEEINGKYVMNDKSESTVEITDAQLEEVHSVVESIRNEIII
jgi:hypothetical protein